MTIALDIIASLPHTTINDSSAHRRFCEYTPHANHYPISYSSAEL